MKTCVFGCGACAVCQRRRQPVQRLPRAAHPRDLHADERSVHAAHLRRMGGHRSERTAAAQLRRGSLDLTPNTPVNAPRVLLTVFLGSDQAYSVLPTMTTLPPTTTLPPRFGALEILGFCDRGGDERADR
jgi:hypothetical protein